MWNNSFIYQVEYGCLVTPQGVITFGGERGLVDPTGNLKPTWDHNKLYVTLVDKTYLVLASGHVHWENTGTGSAMPSGLSEADFYGDNDRSTELTFFEGKVPIFVMGWNRSIYLLYGKGSQLPDITVSPYKVDDLFNGNFSLINKFY